MELAPIRDAGLVVPEIAATLGVREEPDRPLMDTLTDYLSERELLLLLDNFEQVQDAARDVALLLRQCPRLKVLTTSRQPLRISGERGFRVPPMALPAADTTLTLEEVAQFDAVRLFVERAQTAAWDFSLDQENVADVLDICRKLDGLPLAIELATVRLMELTPQQLREALDERLNVLTDGNVDLLEHQQTLRDLIAWSYDLLSEEERRLWRRLGVFMGGWIDSAATQICDLENELDISDAVRAA